LVDPQAFAHKQEAFQEGIGFQSVFFS